MPSIYVGDEYQPLTLKADGFHLNDSHANHDPELTSILTDYMDKLATYGTSKDLALAFEESGLQAMPGVSDRCAIAEHANANLDLPEDVEVHVGGSDVMLRRRTEREVAQTTGEMATLKDIKQVAEVPHNEVTRDFIGEFDNYKYPALVEPEKLAEYRAKLYRIDNAAKDMTAVLSAESAKLVHDLASYPQKYMAAGMVEPW